MKAQFTLRDLFNEFGTTEQCLAFIKKQRFPNGIVCSKCERITRHYLRSDRKAYSCQHCGTLEYVTKGTVFQGTRVPLFDWFYVIFQFAKTRTGIAAKQIERELGVSYPTALRMCNAIRERLDETPDKFDGVVEMDETYMGNSRRYMRGKRKRGRGTDKNPVFGIVERGGKVVAKVVDNCKRDTLMPIIKEAVEQGAEVYTDEFAVYNTLSDEGYVHDTVKHGDRQYVKYREDGARVHTNSVEGFWSYPKNATKGVHRGVSNHKLQGYVNEYAFRTSHRNDEKPMFFTLMNQLLPPQQYAQGA